MPLTKTPIQVNFGMGLDTKTDPKQVQIGKFLSLENSIFQKGGLLQKRNGYGPLDLLSPANAYLTTLNDNLLSIGSTVSAYSKSLETWITKGQLQPCALNVLPLIRNNVNQTQCDAVVANGLVCTVYTQTNDTNSGIVTQYLYAIADAVTGQNIVEPSTLPVISGGTISGSSRVFVVGNYFVIVSQVLVSATTSLQYCSIPVLNPSIISAAQTTCSNPYVPITSNPGWDGVVSNNTLVLAYNTTSSAQGIQAVALTLPIIIANQESSITHAFANAANIGAIVSVCVDTTASPNIFYINFWNNSTSNGYTCAVYMAGTTLQSQFTPQKSISDLAIVNLASAAQNGSCTLFSEETNAYSYDSAIPSNFINTVSISSSGSVGSLSVCVRSVGLASKACILDGTIYFLASYESEYQPSYFLMNGSLSKAAAPIITSKLAYSNGGGYLMLGLPSLLMNSGDIQTAYLYKDLVEALNTENNTQQSQSTSTGVYSQTGINFVSFNPGTLDIDTSEIAQNLQISGGYLGNFDGYLPVENNFFLFPDNVEATWTETSTVTPTGTASNGSKTIVVSSASGVYPGMTIADSTNSTYIPAGTTIIFVNGTTITMSAAATHAISGDTLSIQGNIAAVPSGGTEGAQNYWYQATYEWTDNNGLPSRSTPSIAIPVATSGSGSAGSITINVPTLRLTYKTANPVKIVIYRWSEFTQVYNQVTTIIAPILNSLTTDSVTFVDVYPDSEVQGGNILYTTGGVVPDVNGPANNGIMTLFNASLAMTDAENPNNLWLSKTIIPGTPVEMSEDFVIYVSPTQGTVGSLGPITALAPMDDKLIIFFANGISYINGFPPPITGATSVGCSLGNYSQPIFITSVVGCTNQQSIVLTSSGLMFQSDKGIWQLGRDLSTQYIGSPVEAFNSSTVNSAVSVPETNYVLFTLSTGQMLMYDYYYQQWGTFVGAPAISSCIYQGLHTLLTPQGSILQETPGAYLDNSNPVLMKFTTSWLNIAGVQGYERFYWFYFLGDYLSPHKLFAQIAYNYNSSIVSQAEINPLNFSSAVPSPFGDQPAPFGSPPSLEQWEIHAKYQKCQSFQITLQEEFDPSFGTVPGPGFTCSGLNVIIGVKRGSRPIAQIQTAG